MPHDIFISYSSKDKEKADQLTELLTSAGLSVWIDQSNLNVASSWSRKIVETIEECKVFLLLLSESALASEEWGARSHHHIRVRSADDSFRRKRAI